MKTKTFSILFALVMVLSMSVGVFAQDSLFDETWDENTVLTVFSDMDLVFPDLFADEDSDYLWADGPSAYPNAFPTDSNGNYWAKAPIAPGEGEGDEGAEITGKFTYDPCGDGLVKFEATLTRLDWETYVTETGTEATWSVDTEAGNKYGPEKTSYIRNIYAYVSGDGDGEWQRVNVKKCMTRGEDDCDIIHFNSKGEAKLKGYLQTPFVFDGSAEREVKMYIQFSNYFTALWQVPSNMVKVTGTTEATKRDYCQISLDEFAMGGLYSVRAKYDQHTGEARFQAVVRNLAQESNKEAPYKAKKNYVIPADILIPYNETPGVKDVLRYGEVDDYWTDPNDPDDPVFEKEEITRYDHYTDYTCKYTIYNNFNGAPRTDYCKFGEGIALPPNALIRFDITIDHLSTNILKAYDEGNIPFNFRVGGMTYLVGGPIDAQGWYDGEYAITSTSSEGESSSQYMAAFAPVDFPCPYISRLQVKDPLNKFATFFEMDADPAIKPSGAYGVYEGGLWGLYQKCGKFAYMAVRLKNDGLLEEVIDLKHVAVAVNGGTPMAWNWVLATQEPVKNKIFLDSGEEVILIGRAKVTDIRSQLNADTAMTGAINFLDYGFYITGKVYSDHNNTNCVAAPK